VNLMGKLSEAVAKLIEKKNFGHLATLMPDGTPHVTPVWIDHEGDVVLVNTAEGRVKVKNVRKDPRVAISIVDQ
jgi:PPOX class probable F420-dependent enzyme